MNFEALKRRVERSERLVEGRIEQASAHRASLGRAWQQAWTPGRIIVIGLVGGFLAARARPWRALGAVSAIRAAGKVGKVQVVGYDNIDAIKPMLKDGRVLATADQAAAKQAVYGIETALKLVKKEPVENLKDGVIDTPVELVINK